MLVSEDQRPIPSCLSHHTSLVGLKGKLSPIKEKVIRFRSVSMSEHKEIENFLREKECNVPIYLLKIIL